MNTEEHDNPEFQRNRGPRQEEHDLMAAILEQAVTDLMNENSGGRRAKENAEDVVLWLMAGPVTDTSDRPWLFSFESICEHLDCDPEVVRKGILKKYNEQG